MRDWQTTQILGWFLALVLLCAPHANTRAHGRSVKNNLASQPSYWGAYSVKHGDGKPIRKLWVFGDRVAETYPQDSAEDALASETQLFTMPVRVAGGLGIFGIPVAFPDAGVTAVTMEQLSCSFTRDGATSKGICRDNRNRAFNFLVVADRLTRFELPCDGNYEKTCVYDLADGQPITKLFLESILNTRN